MHRPKKVMSLSRDCPRAFGVAILCLGRHDNVIVHTTVKGPAGRRAFTGDYKYHDDKALQISKCAKLAASLQVRLM